MRFTLNGNIKSKTHMLNFEMIMGKHHAYRPKHSFDAKYTRVVENKWLFNHKERI